MCHLSLAVAVSSSGFTLRSNQPEEPVAPRTPSGHLAACDFTPSVALPRPLGTFPLPSLADGHAQDMLLSAASKIAGPPRQLEEAQQTSIPTSPAAEEYGMQALSFRSLVRLVPIRPHAWLQPEYCAAIASASSNYRAAGLFIRGQADVMVGSQGRSQHDASTVVQTRLFLHHGTPCWSAEIILSLTALNELLPPSVNGVRPVTY